ncbi:MAG: methyltransferase domain-containing protein [Anaerolineae bacterium]|nr:methyltransferase domain-containing protein [Anaerolineae bacterium]
MPWWEDYFGELYLRLSQATLTPDRTARELAGVITMLKLRPGARILDIGCGQGRHAVPLARAGFRVRGMDRSSYLLQEAQRAARAQEVDLHLVRGDMRSLPWGPVFDGCISLFTGFGYFEEEDENEQALAEMARVLRPGGMLILDVSNRDYYLLRSWPYTWRRQGQAVILEENSFDPETSRFTTKFTWLEGSQAETLTHSVRHYTAPELKGMLRRAGLVPAATYGGFDASPFDLDSKRLIMVARKVEGAKALKQ